MDNLELVLAAAFILDLFIGYRIYVFLKKYLVKFLQWTGNRIQAAKN
jgi:hypothetical protein